MKINYNSNKAIILQFPRFAGGKFISNCLALSKYAVPQDATVGSYLLDNPEDYDYRVKQLTTTLPPSTAEMRNWINKYEFGDKQQEPILDRLSNNNLNFFLMAHQPTSTIELLERWPNAKVIVLTNFRRFSDISYKHKNNGETINSVSGNYCIEKYNVLKGDDWPTWDEFNVAKFNVNNLNNLPDTIVDEMSEFYVSNQINTSTIGLDIDSCIFDRFKFLSSIEDLYNQLGYTDFNPKLVSNFWQQYINLHIDTNDTT
jgi:hypothetical protein